MRICFQFWFWFHFAIVQRNHKHGIFLDHYLVFLVDKRKPGQQEIEYVVLYNTALTHGNHLKLLFIIWDLIWKCKTAAKYQYRKTCHSFRDEVRKSSNTKMWVNDRTTRIPGQICSKHTVFVQWHDVQCHIWNENNSMSCYDEENEG